MNRIIKINEFNDKISIDYFVWVILDKFFQNLV